MKKNITHTFLTALVISLCILTSQWQSPLQVRAAEENLQNQDLATNDDTAREDDCALKYFKDLYESGLFQTDNEKIKKICSAWALTRTGH